MPPPVSLVNSLGSMPILRSTHSKGSHPPVVTAICGMSPSLCLAGNRITFGLDMGLSVQAFTWGMVSCLRHLPSWMTSGMFWPTGTFFSTKRPSEPVSAVTRGAPLASTPH